MGQRVGGGHRGTHRSALGVTACLSDTGSSLVPTTNFSNALSGSRRPLELHDALSMKKTRRSSPLSAARDRDAGAKWPAPGGDAESSDCRLGARCPAPATELSVRGAFAVAERAAFRCRRRSCSFVRAATSTRSRFQQPVAALGRRRALRSSASAGPWVLSASRAPCPLSLGTRTPESALIEL